MPGAPLIVRFGALGDLVLCTAVMRALAQRHGVPCDVVASGGWPRALFAHLPFVGEVRTIASRKTPYWFSREQRALVAWLRARAPAAVWLLQSDAKSLRLLRRAGLRPDGALHGFPHWSNEHVVDQHARCAGFDAVTFLRAAELRVSAAEDAECQAWLVAQARDAVPLVLIQPGNKRTMKGRAGVDDLKFWPEERWIAVCRGVLAAQPLAHVLVIGSPSERYATEPIASVVADARCVSVAHDLPLRRLAALLARAHSLISVDTGPAHMAAALGCPVAVLFGKTDPRRNRPMAAGSPVAVIAGPPDAPPTTTPEAWARCHDMELITPEAVLTAWRGLRG